MINLIYEYADKKFSIRPYCTSQEKDLLLLGTIDECNLDSALLICGLSNEVVITLTDEEKLAFLYKFREISVGAEVDVKFKCRYCNSRNENSINIENIIIPPTLELTDDLNIKDCFKELTDANITDFLTVENIDELDIDEYELLTSIVGNHITTFDFKKPCSCQKCTKINLIELNSVDFVLSIMSEDSLISLYQTYNDMIYFGKYSKQDVDTLYPFERTILLGLLNKTLEDISNG